MSATLKELQTEFTNLTREFKEYKERLTAAIEFEDFEMLSSYDLAKVKELGYMKSALYWKIQVAVITAELESLKAAKPTDFKDEYYCRLVIKKFRAYDEQKKAECKAKGDEYGYLKHHKPVIESRINHWMSAVENRKQFGGLKV